MATEMARTVDERVCKQFNRIFSTYALRHNTYMVPIDQQDQRRLATMDEIMRVFSDGRLSFAPLPQPTYNNDGTVRTYPSVLDCGAGSGMWIRNLLEERRGNINITAIDIYFSYGIAGEDSCDTDSVTVDDRHVEEYVERRWNLNHTFAADNSKDKLRPKMFDLVNSRFMAEGVNATRWPGLITDPRQLLRPGGWIQMAEFIPHIQSHNGRLSDESYLTTWWLLYSRPMTEAGKNVRVARVLEHMLINEEFQPVGSQIRDVAIGS